MELRQATNLAAMDKNGYSDPYIVFSVSGQERKSPIKMKTLNPKWNQIFEFRKLTKQQAAS